MARFRRAMVGLTLLLGACAGGGDYVSPAAAPTPGVVPSTSTSTSTSTSSTAPPTTTTTAPAPTTTSIALAAGVQERRLPTAGSSTVLRYDAGVAASALTTVEDALAIARDEFGDSGPLLVHIYSDVDTFVGAHDPRAQQQARDDVEAGSVATASGGVIWIYGPHFAEQTVANRPLVVLHEYFHTVQSFLSSGRSGRVPLWLREGSARYFEYRGGANHTLTDFSRRRATEVRVSRPLDPLENFETAGGPMFRGGGGEAYTLGFLATEYLANAAGIDVVKHDFWAALKPGTDWHTVFANSFGVSVDQFYADFAAYRATL